MARKRGVTGLLTCVTVLLIAGCSPSTQASPVATATSTAASPAVAASPDDESTAVTPTAPTEVGVIAAVPRAPHPLWTVALHDLVPGWSDASDPTLGDVAATPHSLPGFRGLNVGGVLVLGLGSIVDDHLVGVDAATGAVRWHIGPDGADGRTTSTCVGESPDHLVVCLGTTSAARQIQLLDAATGRLARTIPLAFPADSIGVAGNMVIAHGIDPATGAYRRDGIDLSTGATAWSVVAPAGATKVDETGDPVAATEVLGATATLTGLGYTSAIDVRTGAELDPRFLSTRSMRLDGLVSGIRSDRSWSAALAGGPLIELGDRSLAVPQIWYHPASGSTPVFLTSHPTGGKQDTLVAIDPLNGVPLWSVTQPGAWAVGMIGDDVVVRGDEHISLLDQRTGAVRWVVPGRDVVGFDGSHLVVLTSRTPTTVLTSVDVAAGSVTWSSTTPGGDLLTVGDQLLATDGVSLTGFGR